MAERDLTGLRVLVVEDEAMVAMLVEDTLTDIGCEVVGVASDLEEATAMATSLALDAAVLDVNLNGVRTFPVAETLSARRIPFLFSTGYGATGIPDSLKPAQVLTKPFRRKDLELALRTMIDGADRA